MQLHAPCSLECLLTSSPWSLNRSRTQAFELRQSKNTTKSLWLVYKSKFQNRQWARISSAYGGHARPCHRAHHISIPNWATAHFASVLTNFMHIASMTCVRFLCMMVQSQATCMHTMFPGECSMTASSTCTSSHVPSATYPDHMNGTKTKPQASTSHSNGLGPNRNIWYTEYSIRTIFRSNYQSIWPNGMKEPNTWCLLSMQQSNCFYT